MAREKQGRGAPLHTPGVVRSHVLHSQVRGCRPTADVTLESGAPAEGRSLRVTVGSALGSPASCLSQAVFPVPVSPQGASFTCGAKRYLWAGASCAPDSCAEGWGASVQAQVPESTV